MTTSTTSIDIMGLQAAYANLHTDQERDYFMQRYHDVISSFGGKTSYDADNRPLLVMRSNLWVSGYDVDGTDQTSLCQFSGRVQQTYKHRSEERRVGKECNRTLKGIGLGIPAEPLFRSTDQVRVYFMQRYHDVISSFGGKTSYDADNRPLLVMRSNLWASGYDVDGTDQTSLGQFSGRVQQTYKH